MEMEIFCQHCGHKNKSGDTLCVSCRQPLFVICSACEHANPSILNYCLKCGNHLPKKSNQTFAREAERRYLNVMFCDLVGSTALSEKLDPEELREVVVAYQDVCAEAIEEMGGTIAQYLGDGILVYFGYPVAYEDGSQRAVKAALKIIGNMGSLNEKLKSQSQSEVSVRIGIHTGLAVIGEIGRGEKRERLALGDTPNIAARIQGLAEPGTVVISSETHKLVERFFYCEPRGTHLLKGITTPMTIYQPLSQSVSTVTHFTTGKTSSSPLIGREEVLKKLMKAWNLSLKNSEEIALVIGEAGMGKTHLLHEFISQTQSENPITILAQCAALFQNNSFYPVTGILFQLAGIDSSESDEEKLSKLENFLKQNDIDPATAVPALAIFHGIPFIEKYESLTLASALLKEKAFQQLKDLFIALSKKSPVILLLEDLQRADPSTLEFLQYLFKEKGSNRILYLFSCRPEFSAEIAAGNASWINDKKLHRFEIAALHEKQVKVFAEHLSGNKKLPEELLKLIVSKTDGVPLFIEELMTMILKSGKVEVKGNKLLLKGSLPDLSIPSSLQDLLIAKLDQLKEAKEVAQIGAVFGRDFTADVMEAISNLEMETLMDHLGKLVSSGLLVIKGEAPHFIFSFKHALVQEKAYELLLRTKRQQYHAIIAEVLEKGFPEFANASPEFMAHHFSLAGKNKEAIQYCIKAGRTSLEKSAHLEAIICFNKGLALLSNLPESLERDELEFYLQSGKAPALLTTRGYTDEEMENTYDRAAELCEKIADQPQLVLVLRGLWSLYTVKADHIEAARFAKRMERIAEQTDDVLIWFEAGKVIGGNFFWRGKFQESASKLELTLKKFDPAIHYKHIYLYSEHPVVACLSYQAYTLWSLGYADRAIESSLAAVGYAKKLNHPFSITYALGFAGVMHQLKKDVTTTLSLAKETEELGAKYGFAFWRDMGTILKSWAQMENGDANGLKKMELTVKDARAHGLQLWISSPLTLIAEQYGKNNQPEKGLSILNEALELAVKLDDLFYYAELYRIKGFLLQQTGKATDGEIEKNFRMAFDIAEKQSAKNYELRAACDLAKLKIKQGERDEALKILLNSLNWFPPNTQTEDVSAARKLLREFQLEERKD